jgi:hypothetical protein
MSAHEIFYFMAIEFNAKKRLVPGSPGCVFEFGSNQFILVKNCRIEVTAQIHLLLFYNYQ